MENDLFDFLRPSDADNQHPIDRSVGWWLNRNSAYKKILNDGPIIPSLIKAAKLCVTDKSLLEAEAENFVDGLVIFAEGFSKGDEGKMERGELLSKPILNQIIQFVSSDSFKTHVLELHVSGDEKLPISVPEIPISVKGLLIYSNKINEVFFNADQVADLKKGFLEDKMKEWEIFGEFGKKLKLLESFLHPKVFNPNGFLLFDFLMKSQDFKKRGAREDIIYFFHQMKRGEYIHAGRDVFKNWVNDHYKPIHLIEKIHDERSKTPAKRKERYLEGLAFIQSKKV